jgi:hypothetical protein
MEKRDRTKLKKKLGVIGCCLAASAISLSAATALAAYVTIRQYDYSVNYQTENIGTTYFAGGSGTTAAPYLISTPDQLRNLQRLNSLGLFNSTTVFNLTADITWDSTPLLPIGSDDVPFEGVFDGKGHKITNLIVDGKQTWDVGMFGYVSIVGVIKNFILVAPTINLGANTNGGSSDTTNPMDSYLRTAAQGLHQPSATETSSNYVHWTNSTASATIAGLDTSVTTTINGSSATFNIAWESSNTALLSLDNGVWTTHPTASSEYPGTDLYQAMLTARVYAEVNGYIMAYTLERYEINVLGNGTITTGTTSITNNTTGVTVNVQNGIFKTIWPLDVSGGTADYHSTYVGFFCGHLDGYAMYLGLAGGNSYSTSGNGKIVVNGRVAKSNSSLVGRCRGDDVRDGTGSNQYGHTFDFTKDVTWTSYAACAKPYNTSDPTYYYRYNGSTSSSYFNGNMARQNSQSNDLTKAYLKLANGSTDTETYKYMRIYPTASHTTGLTYTYQDGAGQTQTVSNASGIRFSEPLAASVDTDYRDWYYDFLNLNGQTAAKKIQDRDGDGDVDEDDIIKSDDYNNDRLFTADSPSLLTDLDSTNFALNLNVPLGYSINNGFWVYTKGDNADLINTITGKNEFRLTFTINYVAHTTDGTTVADQTKNAWQILYNANNQDVHKYQPLYEENGSYYGFYYKDAAMQNCLWYDLNHPYTYNSTLGRYSEIASKYTPVTIYADDQLHTANVTIDVNRGDSSFWSAYYENYFSSSTWFPCFAIGPGKSDSTTHWKATAFRTASQITNDNWSNYYTIWKGPFTESNSQYDPDVTKSQRGINNTTGQFYNSYFQLDGNLTIDVLSFSSIFTNANGNIAQTMNNVDYLYDASTCTFDTTTDTTSATYDAFSTWNRASGVKVGFDVTTALATGNSTYYYYRELGSDGFGATVHTDYTNASYVPTNGTGYTLASFTKR